ncbi:MAG: lysophospholipid acyltransferase family protein [Vicinamibacterales bacterium]
MVPDWRASRRKRAEAALIAAAGAPAISALGRTWRWRVEGWERLTTLEQASKPPILALWHGRILSAAVLLKHRGIVALASDNFDGQWIATILQRFGYGIARGSSSRGGVKGLVRLKREAEAGRTTAFTVDGPRGPAYSVQPGCVWLAKATGSPILPFHIEADAFWTASSWDHAQIPKPFAAVRAVFGQPFLVDAHVTDDQLEAHRVALERSMRELMGQTVQRVGAPS